MARKNQSERINALVAIAQDIATIVGDILEIHCPGSEPAQARINDLRLMLVSLIDNQAGFPSIQTEETTNAHSSGSRPEMGESA